MTQLTRLAKFVSFNCLLALSLLAQSPNLSSGEVTVKLIQGIDSAMNRPNQRSMATVTKSTNPDIPRGGAGIVQLFSDPANGYSVQLIGINIGGQARRTASSEASLAGGLVGKLQGLRVPGAPQDSVSGKRVFLPQGTYVQFVLAPLSQQISRQPDSTGPRPIMPSQPIISAGQPIVPSSAPPAPNWIVSDMGEGKREATLRGTVETGGRVGPATLAVDCTVRTVTDQNGKPATVMMVGSDLLIPKRIISFTQNDLSCFGDGGGNNYGRFRIASDPENQGDFCVDEMRPEGKDGMSAFTLGPRDLKAIVAAPGKPFAVGLRLPNSETNELLARFQMPQDGAALEEVTRACFEIQDKEAANERAARVVSCPDVPGQTLKNVKVLSGAAMTEMKPDPDNDIGVAWNFPKVKTGTASRRTLACYYGSSESTNTDQPLQKKLLPIPPSAAFCVFRQDGHCSTAAGKE